MGSVLIIKGANFESVKVEKITPFYGHARGDISSDIVVYKDNYNISNSTEIGYTVNQWLEQFPSAKAVKVLELDITTGLRYKGSVRYRVGSGFMTYAIIDSAGTVLQVGPVKSQTGNVTFDFDFTAPTDAKKIVFTSLWDPTNTIIQIVEMYP